MSGGEGHEPMGPLCAAGRAQTDGSGGSGSHGVVMRFVGLDVGAEFDADMFVVVDLSSGHDVSW